MPLSEELRASLEEILAPGSIEIREGGGRLSAAPPVSWEIRGASEKPLLHVWSETCNVTRRVLAITSRSDSGVTLSVERFGRGRPERMEIVRLEFERSAKAISRENFAERIRGVLADEFPEETVERISIAPDLEHSLSRVYARGVSRRGSTSIAFLAVAPTESADALDGCLAYALLWMDKARQASGRAQLATLRLILPKGKSAALANRLRAMDRRTSVEVFELDPMRDSLERVDPCADGNPSSWLVPTRDTQALLDLSDAALAPIVVMEPNAIRAHAIPATREVVLRFRGLAFARWQDGKVFFGAGKIWEELLPGNQVALKQLVANLITFRDPLASNTRHPLYRAFAERWMQAVVRQDVTRIDFALDPQHVYEHVFAQVAGQRGVLDLLCVTRTRRLAIIELKAKENLDLALQAADYWSRIRWQQTQDNLQRYGYFAGIELQPAPPLVYLVAPALHFHPATDVLLRYLSPEIEVTRVGLAETWRRGLRVMFRM